MAKKYYTKPGTGKAVSNYEVEQDGKGKRYHVPKPMAKIIEDVRKSTGDWPRMAGGLLFVVEGDEVQYLEKQQSFFGWLHTVCGQVQWENHGPGYVSRQEFFEEWRRTCKRYDAFETIPHEPTMISHYYVGKEIPPGDGSHLAELVGFFSPETSVDRELIRALFVAPCWGGPPGRRPAWLVAAEDGRGCGKSKLCQLVASLYGGMIDVLPSEKMEKIKTRILSPEAVKYRLCLLDNIKTARFSWGELEGVITAETLSGRKLYVGEGARPNFLTWLLTMNGASLSTDLAQRVVEIRLTRPPYDPEWEGKVFGFIREKRKEILGDIIAFLRQPVQKIAKPSRWPTFDREIIGRLYDPDAVMEVIHSRRAECDSEGEEADLIRDEFVAELRRLGYDTERDDIFIPSKVATRILNAATGDRNTATTASRLLKQLHKEGRLHELKPGQRSNDSSRKRGFRWIGVHCLDSTPTANDIESRLRELSMENDRDASSDESF